MDLFRCGTPDLAGKWGSVGRGAIVASGGKQQVGGGIVRGFVWDNAWSSCLRGYSVGDLAVQQNRSLGFKAACKQACENAISHSPARKAFPSFPDSGIRSLLRLTHFR